ncbi:hypothetical protein N7470_004966 [Penicillium chermesinum]|nr:hypothetical protein N7470_004966 [Penicillium chermesinum]
MEIERRSDVTTPSGSESPGSVDTPATERGNLFDELDELLRRHSVETPYILVTGGLGFIGSHTTLELLKAHYNVIVVDNLSNAFEDVFDRVARLAREFHEQNGTPMPRAATSPRQLSNGVSMGTPKSKIAGVIHFAAYKAVEESIRHPLKYYANNVGGLIDFAATLGDYGIKTFIFSSSATVYGTLATSGLPLKEELCAHKEEVYIDHDGVSQTIQPGCTGITNPYGRTKWICETILADLAASDPEWTIVALRYFNPVGAPTNLLPVVIKVMTGQYSELSMFGSDWETKDGTAVRDFIHVTDLARGHIAALSTANAGKLAENFRTFNLGTGYGNSVMDVVNTMEAVSSQKIPKRVADRRKGDVGYCVAVADRSQQELQWKTEKTLKDACTDICNFLEVRKMAM